MNKYIKLFLTGLVLMTIANCGGGGTTISTSSTSDAFDGGNTEFNPQMDILWVVDPSKSMFEEVEKVRSNISVFIESFIELGYSYRMGVISSSAWSQEAYLADSTNLPFLVSGSDPVFARLHKGQCVDRTLAGTKPEFLSAGLPVGTFLTEFNRYFDVYGVDAGTAGCGIVGPPFGTFAQVPNNFFEDSNGFSTANRQRLGEYVNDERPLQSVRAFLNSAAGAAFVRPNAHLAIIIVSDEQDASRDSLVPNSTYVTGAPGNHNTQLYLNFLDTYKSGRQNYSIYSIVDTTQIGNISRDIAVPSGGLSFDINASQADYVTNLSQIGRQILVSASFFPIAYRPIPSTIQITIIKQNGLIVVVPADTGSGGFTYISAQQGIVLSAAYLPARNDAVKINYVPAQLISGVSDQPRLTMSNLTVVENAVDTVVGTVSLLFANSTNGVYSITDDASNGFEIDPTTGTVKTRLASNFDAEAAPNLKDITVRLTIPGVAPQPDVVFNKEFTIAITDVPDSNPVAVLDSYVASESNADPSGNIRLAGNLSFNDTGLDAIEPHTWISDNVVTQLNGNTATNSVVVNTNGTFVFNVNALQLNLNAGQTAQFRFSYFVRGTLPAPIDSAPVNVTITVNGSNQSPIISTAIADQTVEFTGGLIQIPILDSGITVSGTALGNKAQMIDANLGAGFESASAGAHDVKILFPNTDAYEVDRFEVTGGHSLGNAIFQVLAQDGTSVITREVLPVSLGSTLTVPMNQKVIGRGVRILRPVGSKNANNDVNLRINEVRVFGILAQGFSINLYNNFSDADRLTGDKLTFFATEEFGEGPAPSWLSITQDNSDALPANHAAVLSGIPPAAANVNVGIVAQDSSGATVFEVFNIRRIGAGGSAINGAPIALLPLQDEKRGGFTLKRFGGGSANANPQLDNQIVWGEIDNFFVDPYAGQPIRDAFTMSGLCTGGTGTCQLSASGFRTNPASIPDPIENLLPANQRIHFGDNYSTENGWSSTPVYTDVKFPNNSAATCVNSAFLLPGNGGRVTPCINAVRSYAETYSGYFVPAKTGIYRFRTRTIDDNIRLFLAPTEYIEDLLPVVTVSFCVSSMVTMTQSVAPGLNTGSTCSSEFRGTPGGPTGNQNGAAVGAPTQIFYEGTTQSYKDGYTLLKQGNAYAFELRFAEGGGQVAFEFEFDRKDQSCDPTTNSPTSVCWDGFRPIDASVLVPAEGADAHDPQVISAAAGVNLNVSSLFYDAEQDTLLYSARLVNPNGTAFVGPGSTSTVAEIGLTINSVTGLLVGTLNTVYTSATVKPRVVFTATERFTANQSATSSLPIKFDLN